MRAVVDLLAHLLVYQSVEFANRWHPLPDRSEPGHKLTNPLGRDDDHIGARVARVVDGRKEQEESDRQSQGDVEAAPRNRINSFMSVPAHDLGVYQMGEV